MERDPLYGLSAPESGWVPAPRYALRRSRLLRLLATMPSGRALEVGCGAGALLDDLTRAGFACTALETSAAARELAGKLLAGDPQVRIVAEPQADWTGRFDLLVACEVLEHIEDDAGALRRWRSWLAPGGRMILSVPARAARWTRSDEYAGHYRRYEKAGLKRLVESCGLRAERLECYGFPVSNLTERARAWIHGRRLRRERARPGPAPDQDRHTAFSGIERSLETRLYRWQSSALGRWLFRLALRLQDATLDRDLGTGYLLLASSP